MRTEQHPEFDYIFCGAGASACLLLLRMHQKGLLEQKSVLIIDQEEKARRDKTFCFWADSKETIVQSLGDIISHSWSSVILPNGKLVQIEPLRYHHVSSLDIYQYIDELAPQYGWQRLTANIQHIEPKGTSFSVEVGTEIKLGKLIFDSRTPTFESPASNETHLHQSFVGWRVTLKDSFFPHAFSFMDFSIHQQHATQFVYVLPYSDGSALVEVTRFGSEKIHPKDAEILLNDYITRNHGAYTILDEEQGCIPMSTAPIKEIYCPGVVQLGARNYSIKPSTGYAFKRMFYHAEEITEMLKKDKSPIQLNRSHAETFSGRFAFYDALLLDILNRNPEFGKPIFETLFQKNSIQRILTFLDEQSTLRQEISIFSGLPLRPFLSALWRKLTSHSLFRPILLTLLCALLIVLPPNNTLVQLIATVSLLAGLILIGIPHGALDHLLETGRIDTRQLPKFILKYISIAVAMAILWYTTPTLSLILFLLYSSWHFGQADGKQWSLSTTESVAWGASVLLYMLGTHFDETNSILASMGTIRMSFEIAAWAHIPWLVRFAYKRNYEGLLTAIMLVLSSQIPLMLAFGIYFIGQHSFTGWKHIKSHLRMSNQALWLHSLPFHIGAWLLLGLFYLVQTIVGQNAHFFSWGNFFIFLACLSLPHVVAMQSMYKISLKLPGKSNKVR